MKKTYITPALFAIILLVLGSCEKKFKETSPLNLKVKMINPDVSDFVTLKTGQIYLSTFGITGDRKQGDDVLFVNNLPADSYADLKTETVSPAVNYSLPQGTYTNLVVNMGIKPKDSIGAIVLQGEYVEEEEGGEHEIHRFIFRYDPETLYSLNTTLLGEINVVSDQNTSANVILDVKYLFANISEQMWHSSHHIEIDGVETILINETENTTIYNLLISRLNAAFSAQVVQ
ncbi:MAG TPA: hypothetical protein PL185_09905 [Flavobacteriales bacterium]|jgi:hypothetical protein|nr:hypothetical protein [Flavobacteriales bacterium]HPH82877.1 hypothetical protein [Flavobacteriales bacterium]